MILLKDAAATKTAILDMYLSFSGKAEHPDDRVIVFFAGHGMTKQGTRGPIGYLVPVNGDWQNLNSLIRWDDLTRNADLIPAKHILFIMDACYSGLAMQRVLPPGTHRFISDMLQRPARQVITAGKADETVADDGGPQGGHSIFTGYLLEGLHGAAADKNGVMTATNLMHYVYQKVGQDNRSRQTPHYGHIDGDGDFILKVPSGEEYLVESVVEVPEPTASFLEEKISRPTFAEKNGYVDPTHPNFGRNDWSRKLGETRRVGNNLSSESKEVSRAFSWLSLIVEPVANQPISIDIAQEANRLPQLIPSVIPARDKPYHEQFMLPRTVMTTFDSVLMFNKVDSQSEFWKYYFRLDKKGNMEYASTGDVFWEYNGVRAFRYVQVIGLIWQFVFFAKSLLGNAGYAAGIRFLVNLVGTRNTILIDFSRSPGEGQQVWRSPLDGGLAWAKLGLDTLGCHDPNLQTEHKIVIGNLSEAESQKLILDIAHQLGLAYNHKSPPRCFNYNTNVFPWAQYFNEKSW